MFYVSSVEATRVKQLESCQPHSNDSYLTVVIIRLVRNKIIIRRCCSSIISLAPTTKVHREWRGKKEKKKNQWKLCYPAIHHPNQVLSTVSSCSCPWLLRRIGIPPTGPTTMHNSISTRRRHGKCHNFTAHTLLHSLCAAQTACAKCRQDWI